MESIAKSFMAEYRILHLKLKPMNLDNLNIIRYEDK